MGNVGSIYFIGEKGDANALNVYIFLRGGYVLLVWLPGAQFNGHGVNKNSRSPTGCRPSQAI
jgi:hypothetical protein